MTTTNDPQPPAKHGLGTTFTVLNALLEIERAAVRTYQHIISITHYDDPRRDQLARCCEWHGECARILMAEIRALGGVVGWHTGSWGDVSLPMDDDVAVADLNDDIIHGLCRSEAKGRTCYQQALSQLVCSAGGCVQCLILPKLTQAHSVVERLRSAQC